jgi:hypothetical protein
VLATEKFAIEMSKQTLSRMSEKNSECSFQLLSLYPHLHSSLDTCPIQDVVSRDKGHEASEEYSYFPLVSPVSCISSGRIYPDSKANHKNENRLPRSIFGICRT